jgi:hypothetical protein
MPNRVPQGAHPPARQVLMRAGGNDGCGERLHRHGRAGSISTTREQSVLGACSMLASGSLTDGLAPWQAGRSPDALLLKRGAMYVTRILRIFGVATQDEFGFHVGGGNGVGYEATVAPLIDALRDFRDEVSDAA